jgi:hypothetical protein
VHRLGVCVCVTRESSVCVAAFVIACPSFFSRPHTRQSTLTALHINTLSHLPTCTHAEHEDCEALVLIDLPLPATDGGLLHTAVRLVPASAIVNSLDRARVIREDINHSCGVGINPILFQWMVQNRVGLDAMTVNSEEQLCLLSIVERSCLKAGYPNVDVVGVVAHGVIKNGGLLGTCVRKTLEESRLKLPENVDLQKAWMAGTVPDVQELDDRRVHISNNGQVVVKESRVSVVCRRVPRGTTVSFDPNVRIRLGHGRNLNGAIVVHPDPAKGSELSVDFGVLTVS